MLGLNLFPISVGKLAHKVSDLTARIQPARKLGARDHADANWRIVSIGMKRVSGAAAGSNP